LTQSTQIALKSKISFTINWKQKRAYGIQSPPRQSTSSDYSLYLGAEGNRTEEGQLSWHGKPYTSSVILNHEFSHFQDRNS